MRRTAFKRSQTPLKRSRLRIKGISTSSQLKRQIQAILREIAMVRDQGCVLREYPETGSCSGPYQAEHLVSRGKSATYSDMRNIVCLCQRHHIFWKPQNSRLYWEIIEGEIGPERWDFVKRAEMDKKPHKMDWKLELAALQQELKQIQERYQFNP